VVFYKNEKIRREERKISSPQKEESLRKSNVKLL
jgi:hypothetical protein